LLENSLDRDGPLFWCRACCCRGRGREPRSHLILSFV
jgi:hypothetical protein